MNKLKNAADLPRFSLSGVYSRSVLALSFFLGRKRSRGCITFSWINNGTYSIIMDEFSSPYHLSGDPAICRIAYFNEMAILCAGDTSLSGISVFLIMQNLNDPTDVS